jgi:hypothetical protein
MTDNQIFGVVALGILLLFVAVVLMLTWGTWRE